MTRPIPDRMHAVGMLAALTSTHTCGTACTGTARQGDRIVRLRCPYQTLDLATPVDRLIVQSLYAHEARHAMEGLPR